MVDRLVLGKQGSKGLLRLRVSACLDRPCHYSVPEVPHASSTTTAYQGAGSSKPLPHSGSCNLSHVE